MISTLLYSVDYFHSLRGRMTIQVFVQLLVQFRDTRDLLMDDMFSYVGRQRKSCDFFFAVNWSINTSNNS